MGAPTLSAKLTSSRGNLGEWYGTHSDTTEIHITIPTFLDDPHTYTAWLKGE